MTLALRLWVGLLAIGIGWSAGAYACGAEEAACAVPLGEYRVAVPDAAGPARPALVFFHGFGGSGTGVLRQQAMVTEFTAHGYVVIAPEGLERPGTGRASWNFRPNERPWRDELAFTREILADAGKRWNIDRARVLLAGESNGGSMVWYLACRTPGEFAAFAPVAGGFWDPLPPSCAGPVKLLHTHGWADPTVPLEGRIVRSGLVQGDIFAGLAIWRAANGCATQAPTAITLEGPAWHRRWTSCAPGTWLEFALHDGGHDVPDWWAAMARGWFERIVVR